MHPPVLRRSVIATVLASAALVGSALTAASATAAPSSAPAADRLSGPLVFHAQSPSSANSYWYGVGAPESSTLVPVSPGGSSAAVVADAVAWTTPALGATGPVSPASDEGTCLEDPNQQALIAVACTGAPIQDYRWVDVPTGKALQNIVTRNYLGTASDGARDYLQPAKSSAYGTGAVDTDLLTGGVAPPVDDRLHGRIVFRQGTYWWAVEDPDSGGYGRAKTGADAAAAARAGTDWTTPALGAAGPLSPEASPTMCLDANDRGPVYEVVRCDGSALQQWRWVELPGGVGLQNVADPVKYIGTGNGGGFDDYLEGASSYEGRANGVIDPTYLGVDGGGDDGDVAAPTGSVTFDADVSKKATVSGTGAEGATIELFDGTTKIGTSKVTGGTWSTPIDALGAGKHTIRIEQSGIDGVQSATTEADFGAG
ncbi:Ig-like domain repeat protein, partial [Curtobacterium sp. Leaf183]|uniref:Ig-like domain repeat protein n=1 Tax=Curtobacterium sp. Leaf183 TaxID=1736291 RepID=UPI00138F0A1D